MKRREYLIKPARRGIAWVMISTLVVFLAGTVLLVSGERVPGQGVLKRALLARLAAVDPAGDASPAAASREDTLLYVLGGSRRSLEYKFNKAAELYRQNRCATIVLYSEPGITDYDPALKRNLTNDEWAVRSFVERGVPATAVEPTVKGGWYLGTYVEAKKVSTIARNRGYRHLIVVTSSYHAGRTLMTFAKIMEAQGITISIASADEPVALHGLAYEYLKLMIYKYIILPWDTG